MAPLRSMTAMEAAQAATYLPCLSSDLAALPSQLRGEPVKLSFSCSDLQPMPYQIHDEPVKIQATQLSTVPTPSELPRMQAQEVTISMMPWKIPGHDEGALSGGAEDEKALSADAALPDEIQQPFSGWFPPGNWGQPEYWPVCWPELWENTRQAFPEFWSPWSAVPPGVFVDLGPPGILCDIMPEESSKGAAVCGAVAPCSPASTEVASEGECPSPLSRPASLDGADNEDGPAIAAGDGVKMGRMLLSLLKPDMPEVSAAPGKSLKKQASTGSKQCNEEVQGKPPKQCTKEVQDKPLKQRNKGQRKAPKDLDAKETEIIEAVATEQIKDLKPKATTSTISQPKRVTAPAPEGPPPPPPPPGLEGLDDVITPPPGLGHVNDAEEMNSNEKAIEHPPGLTPPTACTSTVGSDADVPCTETQVLEDTLKMTGVSAQPSCDSSQRSDEQGEWLVTRRGIVVTCTATQALEQEAKAGDVAPAAEIYTSAVVLAAENCTSAAQLDSQAQTAISATAKTSRKGNPQGNKSQVPRTKPPTSGSLHRSKPPTSGSSLGHHSTSAITRSKGPSEMQTRALRSSKWPVEVNTAINRFHHTLLALCLVMLLLVGVAVLCPVHLAAGGASESVASATMAPGVSHACATAMPQRVSAHVQRQSVASLAKGMEIEFARGNAFASNMKSRLKEIRRAAKVRRRHSR